MEVFLTEQAKLGDSDAMFKLGEMLLARDKVQAKSWIEKAAEKNYLPALETLAKICREEKKFYRGNQILQKIC